MSVIKNNDIGDRSQVAGRDINNEIYIYMTSIEKNIPELGNDYEHREEEERVIIERLNKLGILCICGISGIGKTSISIAIADKIKSEYEQIIYIDGSKIKSKDDIDNIYIDRGRYNDNIEGLLVREKVLLIIDNMISNQGNIVNKFKRMRLKNSKIIITSQSSSYIEPKYIYKLDSPTKEICKKILLRNIEINLKDEKNIDLILQKVSGNPLMLNIINSILKYEEIKIDDLVSDINSIMGIQDIDSDKKVCERIISIFLQSCKEEINIILWLETTYIDEELLKHMIKVINYNKIKNRFIFDTTIKLQSNTVKIHDIILSSIKNIVKLNEEENEKYMVEFINYFKKIYKYQNESKEFWNALYLHKNKIKEMNTDNNKWGLKLYLLIKCSSDYEIDYEIDERIDFKYLINCDYSRNNYYFDFLSVIEFLERKRYSNNFESDGEKRKFLDSCIDFIKKSLNNKKIDKDLEIYLTHHLGKFYLFNNNKDEAKKQFKKVVNAKGDCFEAKLQLIRMYKDGDDVTEIKGYVSEILSEYKKKKYFNTTVILATIQELTKDIFADELKEYVLDDLEGFKKLILSESNFYFDLPFKTFIAIGKRFLYTNPEVYEEISKSIPIKISEDISDDSMLFTIGEFYKDLIRSKKSNGYIDEEKKQYLLKESEKYYKKISKPNDYQLKSMCKLYILYEKPDEVFEISRKIKNVEDPFLFYYLSQAYEILYNNGNGQENIEKALEEIDKSLDICREKSKFNRYKSTFYNHKSKLLNYKHDKGCITALQSALLFCDNEKYRNELTVELEELEKKYI